MTGSITRRTILALIAGIFLSPSAFADSKKQFAYVPSKLGINYRSLAPSPLAEILSQGEGEFLENAKRDYGDGTEPVWKDELVPELVTGAVSQITIENLQDFTPNMLAQFAVGLNPQDEKYGYLWSIGTNYVASKLVNSAK